MNRFGPGDLARGSLIRFKWFFPAVSRFRQLFFGGFAVRAGMEPVANVPDPGLVSSGSAPVRFRVTRPVAIITFNPRNLHNLL